MTHSLNGYVRNGDDDPHGSRDHLINQLAHAKVASVLGCLVCLFRFSLVFWGLGLGVGTRVCGGGGGGGALKITEGLL